MKQNIVRTVTLLGVTCLLSMFNNCSGFYTANDIGPSLQPKASSATTQSPALWPLTFIGTDLTTAYPNIEYYSRVAVTGGAYPYTFKLLKAPTGMQIQTRTGEIRWTPTQNNTSETVEVQVTGLKGAIQTHSFTINVTTNNVYFINAVSGSDSDTGALGHAFKTLLGVQSKGLPMTATLYFRAGTYVATGIKMNEMPGLWMAYPGDAMPVLDCQGQKTCIGLNAFVKDPILFQGLNFTNVENEFFAVDGDSHGITWRKNIMNNLDVTNSIDGTGGNPAFIFTASTSASLGSTPTEPPPVYQHLIVQNNQFYDLKDSYASRASASTWYDVSHSLIEDNVIHDVEGACFEDKEDGWFNVFRHNVCYNMKAFGIDLLGQYTSAQEEIDHNLYIGANGSNAVQIGFETGYIDNVYIHNNTFVNGSVNFAGIISNSKWGNFVIENNIFYNDSTDENFAFYGILGDTNPSILPTKQTTIDDNIYWSENPALPYVIWGYQVNKTSLTIWKSLGFDLNSIFTKPILLTNGTNTISDYSLSPTNPDFGIYGKDFSPGGWQ